MAISHQVNLNEFAYRALNTVKGKQSYSDIIMDLVQDHNELVKLKAYMERCKPE